MDADAAGRLVSEIREVASLGEPEVTAMWRLYSAYYGGTSEALFRSDLAGKSYALLSRDPGGEIGGFSTMEVYTRDFDGIPVRVLYSGDTIVHHEYWARNDFALRWIRFASSVKAQRPDVPLWWLLIVKGHRTYRYMSTFGHRYYPAPGWETPPDVQRLMDQLALERFGEAYSPAEGLVRFATSHGHLMAPWCDVPDAARSRREVAYFLERNPGYCDGDELVCLCEFSRENMKPLTRRVFDGEVEHAGTR
jgi:hypothetical protein